MGCRRCVDAEGRREGRNGGAGVRKKAPIDAAVSALKPVKNETGQAASGLYGGNECCSSRLPWKLPRPEMDVTRLTIYLSSSFFFFFFFNAGILRVCVRVCLDNAFSPSRQLPGRHSGNLDVSGNVVSSRLCRRHDWCYGTAVQECCL